MSKDDLDQRQQQLSLKTRFPVEHLLAGEYRSVFKGRGMDFDEIHGYVPGDDVQTIDWNVTARTGTPHIKRYIEERELAVWFLVDTSASCRLAPGGSSNKQKWDVMHEITTLLALSAVQNHDRCGLILFSDRVEHIVPLRRGRPHAYHLLRDMLDVKAEGQKTDLQPALAALNHLSPRRGLVFLLSDFLCEANREVLGMTSFRQDLVAIAVNDPWEKEPPNCGLVEVADAESGETRLWDFRAKQAKICREAFSRKRSDLKIELEAVGADLMELDTQQDCAETLASFFRQRLRRIADESGG